MAINSTISWRETSQRAINGVCFLQRWLWL